jgi:hypothetical protein
MICEYIAYKLPIRVVLWVIVRAYGHVSTHECKGKNPNEIGYEDVWHSINNILEGKTLIRNGEVKEYNCFCRTCKDSGIEEYCHKCPICKLKCPIVTEEENTQQ